MTDFFTPPDGQTLPSSDDLADPANTDDTAAYYGEEPAFDFLMGDIVTDEDGHAVMVSGADAVAQSIEKALRTPRLEKLAYSANYGNEATSALEDPPIGTTPEDIALTYATECIDSDPRVASMDSLDCVYDATEGLTTLTGTVTTTFGDIIELNLTY